MWRMRIFGAIAPVHRVQGVGMCISRCIPTPNPNDLFRRQPQHPTKRPYYI